MAIDFKPEQNDYTNLTPFKTWLIYQINTWGVNNFPFLENDFDQLTNYGMMMKLMKAMNDTIGNQNKVEDDMSKLYEAFTELQTYIDNYFENLDVQEEINNKLDEMAESGELTNLIKNYVDPIYQQYENDINRQIELFETETTSAINNQNYRINNINNKVNSIAEGTPKPVSSISQMTDTSISYLLTTDGYWYYYNGTDWVRGGVYQATSIQDNEITHNLVNLSTYTLPELFKLNPNHSISGYNAEYASTENSTRICTNRVHFKSGDKILNTNTNIYMLLAMCDENGLNNVQQNWINTDYTFINDCYCYISFKYGSAGTTEWTDALIEELISAITINKENSVNIIPEPKPIIPLSLITNDYENIHLENGIIDPDGSFRSLNNRLLTKEYLIWDNQQNFIVNSNTSLLKYSVHRFDENGNKIGGSGWLTNIKEYTIPKCKYFRVQLSKIDESVINPTDDGNLYNYLSFRPSISNEDMQTIANDFNIEYGRIEGTSYVLTRIPRKSASGKNIRPKFSITTDDGSLTSLSSVKSPLDYARYNNTLFVNNSAIFNPTTKAPLGQIILNGVSIQDEVAVRPVEGTPYSDGEVYPLCIDANGNMSAPYPKTITTSEMINDGVKYCAVGWIKIIEDFLICSDDINAEVVHKNERLPQQIVGQYQNGDYFVFTSDGNRANVTNERGLLYSEIAELLVSKGIKFAYAFDGGGSTSTVKERRMLSMPYDNRTVPIVLEFYIDE